MKENLQADLAEIALSEGGFAVRDSEPGGSVNRGVSMEAFIDWRKRKGLPRPTLKDLEALTEEGANTIYTERYADPIRYDDLPSGVDYVLLDAAVNLGVAGASRLLRGVLGLELYENGSSRITDTVLLKVLDEKPATLVNKLADGWLAKKQQSPGWGRFGKGWTNRYKRVLKRALSQAKKG